MTARDTAVYLLNRIENKGAYADRILNSKEMMSLDTRDRAFVREMVPGVLKMKLRLDRIIDSYYDKAPSALDSDVRIVLRLGLFQIMYMDSIPDHAAVSESVTCMNRLKGKGAGGLVNALLRRFLREGEPGGWPDDPAERLSLEFSHPLWIVQRWVAQYGEETTASVLKAGNGKHPVFVRPGRPGIGINELSEILARENFETTVVAGMPDFLKISGSSGGLFDSEPFLSGQFTIQDPSAGMASHLLSPEPGEDVLDLCAAPGGKATQIALLMNDTGKIKAVDINDGRLGLVKDAANRLGLTSITCETGDAESDGSHSSKRYDRVLLDVPCTGTGVFSKRSDLKWRLAESDVNRLAGIQKNMLRNAAMLVKNNGVLVYSTCSLESEENEHTVDDFLVHNNAFTVERDDRFSDFEHESGYLIFPHCMEGTGAFAAKLRRIGNDGKNT